MTFKFSKALNETFLDLLKTSTNIDIQIDLNEMIEWIKMNFNPEDIFDYETLKEWAEEHKNEL